MLAIQELHLMATVNETSPEIKLAGRYRRRKTFVAFDR